VSDRIRIVIADDHPAQRAGVRAALEDGGFHVVAEAKDADGAVEAVVEHGPQVCLLDVHMPGNGIAAAARISAHNPDIAIVMLTVSRDDDDLFDALRAGASGYLLKDTAPERLPLALQGVLVGETPMPRNLVSRLVNEFQEKGRRRRVPIIGKKGVELTAREWEVLNLMREELSTADMAERLFVSPTTIRTHVSTILKKLHVSSREEALRLLDE
jgi:DNA-binding NarL/FixJ family response regulator